MSLDLDLAGRTAVVTGGGGGIGQAVASRLAEAGVCIAVVDVAGPAAERTAGDLRTAGQNAIAIEANIASPQDVAAAISTAHASLGRIDILVNCAGVFASRPVAEMPVEEWQRVLDINLTGAFLCSRAVLPIMIDQGFGRIINFASGQAFRGGAKHVHYAAAKAGILGLTRALASEVAGQGIRVNAISPAVTDTAMPRGEFSQSELEDRGRRNPTGRIGQPEDIALGVVYLASRWADYVNGHTLLITGGDYM